MDADGDAVAAAAAAEHEVMMRKPPWGLTMLSRDAIQESNCGNERHERLTRNGINDPSYTEMTYALNIGPYIYLATYMYLLKYL